jgi:hypothetical protein
MKQSHSGHVHDDVHTHSSHEASLFDELSCHLPYAAFSVALGFVVLSVMHFFVSVSGPEVNPKKAYHLLFHAFHYLHIMFAVVGTFVTFSRFSRRLIPGIVLSLFFPAIFCTLSDVALPALAGSMLGLTMKIHICFFSWKDLMNVLPFMAMGILTGLALRRHKESSLGFFSLGYHFVHILISSLASLFYVASFGYNQWHASMGLLFFLMVLAVVLPCTISDVIVPIYFARRVKRHEKHTH